MKRKKAIRMIPIHNEYEKNTAYHWLLFMDF